MITTTRPAEHALPGQRWTVRKIITLVMLKWAHCCHKSTLWLYLCGAGLSWKKPKKILAKANTAKRLAYLAQFDTLYQEMRDGKRTLLYLDEAHLHQDMDLGSGWYFKGKVWRVPSTTPGLHAKLNWYGAYDFTHGQAMLWSYAQCNGEHTADFLERVAGWTHGKPKPTLIWDGSPVHRARQAQAKAAALGLEIIQLPGYSPDLNPIEGLWKWMREEVTYAYCQPSLEALHAACREFVARINQAPQAMIDRLWPRWELDPDEEKLRLSA